MAGGAEGAEHVSGRLDGHAGVYTVHTQQVVNARVTRTLKSVQDTRHVLGAELPRFVLFVNHYNPQPCSIGNICNSCHPRSWDVVDGLPDVFTFALARPGHGTQASEAGALTSARTCV